jgi:hypothetical protein
MPYIFSWFTLRKGHRTLARVLSFAWLAAFAVNLIPRAPSNIPVESRNAISPAQAQAQTQEAFIKLGTADHLKAAV